MSQSPEGRKRVISNLKRFSRISLEYNKAMKKIIEENKGVPPMDLMEKVDSKVEKKIDKITKLFKEDLNKDVPSYTAFDKTMTGVGAVLGSIVGAPGKLLGKIGGSSGAASALEALI